MIDRVIRGKRVKELRVRLGLTQEQIYEKTGIAPNTLRGLEHGSMDTRPVKYQKLVEALGTTTEAIERTDQPITEDHPLLGGLNDQDLQIAQAYSRARTATRLRVERLLLSSDLDAGLQVGDDVLGLDDVRRDRVLKVLKLEKEARQRELDAQHKKKAPPT